MRFLGEKKIYFIPLRSIGALRSMRWQFIVRGPRVLFFLGLTRGQVQAGQHFGRDGQRKVRRAAVRNGKGHVVQLHT